MSLPEEEKRYEVKVVARVLALPKQERRDEDVVVAEVPGLPEVERREEVAQIANVPDLPEEERREDADVPGLPEEENREVSDVHVPVEELEEQALPDIVVVLDEKRRWRRYKEQLVGVRLPVILSYKTKKKKATKSGEAFKTRVTKRSRERYRRPSLSHYEICAFRNILENIYENMDIPTVPKVLSIARRTMNFQGSKARVRGILRNSLGYRFNKRHPESNIVIERHSVVAQRTEYLKAIRINDELGEFKRPVVYVGEMVLNFNRKSYQTEESSSSRKCPYKKWLIIHAGTENGFIKRAARIKIISRKLSPEEFLRYVHENLITKLPKECIVIMNSSKIHNKQAYPRPSIVSSDDYIKRWMRVHNIVDPEGLSEEDLLRSIQKTHPDVKYYVDLLLAKHGHTVIRIPPFNTDLNPIEYIWMKIKTRISEEKRKGELVNSQLLHREVEAITVEDWRTEIGRVKKIEERYWYRHVEKAVEYEDLSFGFDFLSDSGSDSDTAYEYNHSSSSSEEVEEDSNEEPIEETTEKVTEEATGEAPEKATEEATEEATGEVTGEVAGETTEEATDADSVD